MVLRRSERFWSHCVLAAILALALGLRLWRLDRNGFGNAYYSAGVRSMLESWHNFFFNAFDPAGFVSLDKPPVAFWIQVVSAKLFGFSGFSVLLPQALEGTAAVALLYVVVRRTFGAGTGLLAALFLAVTPISVAVDRSSNTDTCLVMVLLMAAWALSRAAETGGRAMLLLSMTLVGVAFNVKMLAAFIVLPTFTLLYLVGAPISLKRRLADLILGGAILVAVSLSWSLAYDLTPPEARPYVGGTTENSMLELVVGHNGLQRFLSHGRRAAPSPADNPANPATAARPNNIDNEPAGPLRLFSPRLAGQAAWLLPLALFSLFSFGWNARPILPLNPVRRGLFLWGGWAITYGVVYSALSRLSPYYLATMGPPLSALAGVGATQLWKLWKDAKSRSWLPPIILLIAATWEAYIAFGSTIGAVGVWTTVLSIAPLIGALLAVAGLIVAQSPKLPRALALRLAAISCGVGLSALLADPASWSLNSVMTASNNDARPIAGPPEATLARNDAGPRRAGGRFGPADEQKLTAFLQANHTDERYLAATPSARLAAPIIIRTGNPVMAIGGFSGSDPILMQDELARMVANKEIRFVFVGGVTGLGQTGSVDTNQKLTDWIIGKGAPVDPALWRTTPTAGDNAGRRSQGRRMNISGVGDLIVAPLQLYDLNPNAGALRPSSD